MRFHSLRRAEVMLDIHAQDQMEGENLTLYHVLKQRRRRETREISEVLDSVGVTHIRPQDIRRIFVQYSVPLQWTR